MLEVVLLQEVVLEVVLLQEAVQVVVFHLGGVRTYRGSPQNKCWGANTGQGDLGTPHTHICHPSLSHADSTPCTSPVDTRCEL